MWNAHCAVMDDTIKVTMISAAVTNCACPGQRAPNCGNNAVETRPVDAFTVVTASETQYF